jgi:preprotein translocase subunit SecG
MGFLIGLLTFVLVLDCAALILLVLMQLPKKDAGAGLAFGGGATDALFGAGSGNVLTKATKYAATIFFVLALLIGVMQSKHHNSSLTALTKAVAEDQSTAQPVAMPPSTTTPSAEPPTAAPAATNFTLETTVPSQPVSETETNAATAE